MNMKRAIQCLLPVVCAVLALIASSPLYAETREEFAVGLETKLKSATCAPHLRTIPRIPEYKECRAGIGTEPWFKCAGAVDRANKAIFYWNDFVEKCQKGSTTKK